MNTEHINKLIFILFGAVTLHTVKAEVSLLNVSCDPTRELYTEFNKAFASHWKKQTGEDVTIATSHGGSGSYSLLS